MIDAEENEHLVDLPEVTAETVRRELNQILTSRHFRSSKRSQQFLEYVVEQKLQGNEAFIKERLIGIELFGRSSNYVTGDDPVVRVQAGEVRRRLERYLADPQEEEGVRIELPTGTYVPIFRARKPATSLEIPQGPAHEKESTPEALTQTLNPEEAPQESSLLPALPHPSSSMGAPPSPLEIYVKRPPKSFRKPIFLTLLALIVGGVLGYILRAPQRTPDAVTKFWGPVLSSLQPIVINLGKPFVYMPSGHLFDEYAKSHPQTFEMGVDRHNQFLPLDENTPIKWGDMIGVGNSGPAVGGVRASLTLTSFLGKFDKTFTVRFGEEGSFLESREAPSIIVGAMNNRWTIDMDNNFYFRIRDNNSYQYIEESGTKNTWRAEYTTEREANDYGLITRQPIGATGQFLLKIAGLQDGGTEAAAELVTNAKMLQDVIHSLPPNWQSKNLQILVKTRVIARKAGPPEVIAVHVW